LSYPLGRKIHRTPAAYFKQKLKDCKLLIFAVLPQELGEDREKGDGLLCRRVDGHKVSWGVVVHLTHVAVWRRTFTLVYNLFNR